jgi:hypothetical protein
MTLDGLGEMFEGDSVDMCAEKFPLVSMRDEQTRQACADGSEDLHWRERNFFGQIQALLGFPRSLEVIGGQHRSLKRFLNMKNYVIVTTLFDTTWLICEPPLG